MQTPLRLLCGLVCLATGLFAQDATQGSLRIAGKQLECPLRHTSVKADISGMVARVNVTQEFHNALAEKIEAVYTFPLPHEAAVDMMTMIVGGRKIAGTIRKREDAQALYKTARDAGQVASLLEQHRPNVFTQSVANIEPGVDIHIEISYVETLRFEAGQFEFQLVVAPRYQPITDGSGRTIEPPLTPPGTRAGHDISVDVTLDAGLPIGNLASPTHEIDMQWNSGSRATVRLKDQQSIPNKDFILRYQTGGEHIQDALLAHHDPGGDYFLLLLQPPAKIGAADATPKELVFVLDTSGSMMGFPIEKAKEAMLLALDGLYPNDTFNLITFSGDTEILFPQALPATRENVAMAKMFLQSRSGHGGTEMMKAIRAALEPAAGSGRVRVVCFMTDGEVGNDMEILAEVQKHPASRVFAFGIGSSVNRFLLDGMALMGRGEVEYVGLKNDGSAAARRFWQRVRDPLLTDVEIDWGGLPVTDVYPKRIPDLFGAKPVIVTGRYTGPLHGRIQLRAKAGMFPVTREIAVDLGGTGARHDALASLWARQRIADLMSQDYGGYHHGAMRPDLREQITETAMQHGIASQFTSFIAVEERIVTVGGKARKVEVPAELPEGMAYEGLGRAQPGVGHGAVIGGFAAGTPGGVLGGIVSSGNVAPTLPPPPMPRQFAVAALSAARNQPNSAKLDPALAEMTQAGEGGITVTVQILLRDASSATIDKLRAAGLEIVRAPGEDLMMAGRITVEKLAQITVIDAVRYVVKVQSTR
jgi:Ca-activated chloride channel homolog